MKRAFVLFLALVLLLTGCAGKEKTNDVSVDDVCCPYEIKHKNDVVEITLKDGEQSGVLWGAEIIPDDICEVTQVETDKENTHRYHLSGKEEGAARLTFTATGEDGAVLFVLNLVVDVDAGGKTAVTSCQHKENIDTVVEAEGLTYKWNVDADGILNFAFINADDNWSMDAEKETSFVFVDMMSTPSGCKFSVQANEAGETAVVLVGETTGRRIQVVIRADENGTLEVASVQEQ